MTWSPDPNNRPDPDDASDLSAARSPIGPEWADALTRFVSDARTEERVTERRRRRWLQREATESSSFAGLLRTLAERATPVRLLTDGGGTHSGTPVAVGEDVVVLHTAGGRPILVALDHVTAVVDGTTAELDGDRGDPAPGPSLRHLLAELADIEAELTCTLAGGTVVAGRVVWVAEDVLALDPSDPPGRGTRRPFTDGRRYLRLSSLVDVSPRVSG